MKRAVFVDDEAVEIDKLLRFFRAEGLVSRWEFVGLVWERSFDVAAMAARVCDAVSGSEDVVFVDVVAHPSGESLALSALGLELGAEIGRRKAETPILAVSNFESDRDTYFGVLETPAIAGFLPKGMLKKLSGAQFDRLVEAARRRCPPRETGDDRVPTAKAGGGAPCGGKWAILTAKPEEAAAVRKALGDCGKPVNNDEWEVDGCVARVMCADEQGLVNAAMLASEAILRHGATRILMAGMCGVVPGKGEVYDVFLPKRVVQYFAGKLEDGALQKRTGADVQLGLTTEESANAISHCAPELAAYVTRELRDQLSRTPDWHPEPMASADILNVDAGWTEPYLTTTAQDVGAVDMEAYAIGATSKRFGVEGYVVKAGADLLSSRAGSKALACRVGAVAGVLVLRWIIQMRG